MSMKFNNTHLLTLFCGAALGAAAPLGAQEGSGRAPAATSEAARRAQAVQAARSARAAELEVQLEQVRRELESLERRRQEAELLSARLQNDLAADSVRHEVEMGIEQALRTLGRLRT